jgi:hypothetical protein
MLCNTIAHTPPAASSRAQTRTRGQLRHSHRRRRLKSRHKQLRDFSHQVGVVQRLPSLHNTHNDGLDAAQNARRRYGVTKLSAVAAAENEARTHTHSDDAGTTQALSVDTSACHETYACLRSSSTGSGTAAATSALSGTADRMETNGTCAHRTREIVVVSITERERDTHTHTSTGPQTRQQNACIPP